MKDTIKSKKLEGFDITIKTFIPIEEQSNICTLIMESDNFFERKVKLVIGVFCAIVDEEEIQKDLTYNDIVSSGMWDAIYNELYVYIDEITKAVEYYSSLGYQIGKGIDMLANKLTDLNDNLPSIEKVVELLQLDNEVKENTEND